MHVLLLCVIQGEGDIQELGEQSQDESTGLLTIYEVTRGQAGSYECTANNGITPSASVVGQLVVRCEFCMHRGKTNIINRKLKQNKSNKITLDRYAQF